MIKEKQKKRRQRNRKNVLRIWEDEREREPQGRKVQRIIKNFLYRLNICMYSTVQFIVQYLCGNAGLKRRTGTAEMLPLFKLFKGTQA
jgi:hypothetical protein